MRPLRTTVMCMVLVGAATTPAAPQYGLGLGRGFTGLGLRNWALYESGADSIAAWYRLTDEQRGQVEELVGQFRRENADAVARWKQMQGDIQSLMTGNVQPGWAAIYAVGEKYGHPGQELQPALYQLHHEKCCTLHIEHGMLMGYLARQDRPGCLCLQLEIGCYRNYGPVGWEFRARTNDLSAAD